MYMRFIITESSVCFSTGIALRFFFTTLGQFRQGSTLEGDMRKVNVAQ